MAPVSVVPAEATIRNYSKGIVSPRIIDVGCGSDKISNSKAVIGCDMFPVSDDIIKSAADNLPFEDGSVDILVSAHCLEHMANPIKTIKEWCRNVGKEGVIWFILPNRARTFDSLRPLTSKEHLFNDFNNDMPETDNSHWEDFRELVLLSGHRLIPPEYVLRAEANDFSYFSDKRLIHHHVWTLNTFTELVKALGLEVLYSIEPVPGREDSFSIIVRGKIND